LPAPDSPLITTDWFLVAPSLLENSTSWENEMEFEIRKEERENGVRKQERGREREIDMERSQTYVNGRTTPVLADIHRFDRMRAATNLESVLSNEVHVRAVALDCCSGVFGTTASCCCCASTGQCLVGIAGSLERIQLRNQLVRVHGNEHAAHVGVNFVSLKPRTEEVQERGLQTIDQEPQNEEESYESPNGMKRMK